MMSILTRFSNKSRTVGLSLALIATLSATAPAAPLASLTLRDLDGAEHTLPRSWSGGGVLILGFSHDARAGMDQWVEALSLESRHNWLETPVIGAVPSLVRPMILAGMRSRYAGDRRGHVTPVFDNAESLTQFVNRHGDIVVLVLNENGEVLARADGPATTTSATQIQDAMNRSTRE